jgi:2-oxoglutarate ferredoxin oxidoreductase subunit alpha
MQVAFHLADKYRLLSMVMTDFIIGQLAEPVEIRTLELDSLPDKPWGLKGKEKKGGRRDFHVAGIFNHGGVIQYTDHQERKYRTICENEIRFDTYLADDAELLIVSWGSSARIVKGAVNMARVEGLKVGMFRPITLWPYPVEQLREAALKAGVVLVVEDNQGQMLEDVEAALQGKVPLHFLGIWARHNDQANGIIHPERVLQEVRDLI